MLAKRIIPCLDVKDGRVVKGINFIDLIDVGDPVEAAGKYNQAGADELVFLDISATLENRQTTVEMVKKVAAEVTIPFTVGGGIRSCEDMQIILQAGADKISLNSAAVSTPQLIRQGADQFGSQAIVVAIDVKQNDKMPSGYEVCVVGGTKVTALDAVAWALQVEALGAGELLVTSMDKDGTKSGYDYNITRQISKAVNIPVIASGGAGKLEDFYRAFTEGEADAALAASLFHFGEILIPDLKAYLDQREILVQGIDSPLKWWKSLTLNDQGLIPVIVVDQMEKMVLMLAYMDYEAFRTTLQEKIMHYHSRSRGTLWKKGETSGNYQHLQSLKVDCDEDCLIAYVIPDGPTCHTGATSCFYRDITEM